MENLIEKIPKIGRLKPEMAGSIMLSLSQIPLAKEDDQQKLKGVISIKEIFRNPKETIISEIMKKNWLG